MQSTGNAIERIINDDSGGLPQAIRAGAEQGADRHAPLRSGIQAGPSEYLRQGFSAEYQAAQSAIAAIDPASPRRAKLLKQVKSYADTFAEWIKAADQTTPHLALIEIEAEDMLPAADGLIATARECAESAERALKTSQQRTKHVMMAAGTATVLIGLLFSLLIVSQHQPAARPPDRGDAASRQPATPPSTSPPRRGATRSAPWRAPCWYSANC